MSVVCKSWLPQALQPPRIAQLAYLLIRIVRVVGQPVPGQYAVYENADRATAQCQQPTGPPTRMPTAFTGRLTIGWPMVYAAMHARPPSSELADSSVQGKLLCVLAPPRSSYPRLLQSSICLGLARAQDPDCARLWGSFSCQRDHRRPSPVRSQSSCMHFTPSPSPSRMSRLPARVRLSWPHRGTVCLGPLLRVPCHWCCWCACRAERSPGMPCIRLGNWVWIRVWRRGEVHCVCSCFYIRSVSASREGRRLDRWRDSVVNGYNPRREAQNGPSSAAQARP